MLCYANSRNKKKKKKTKQNKNKEQWSQRVEQMKHKDRVRKTQLV